MERQFEEKFKNEAPGTIENIVGIEQGCLVSLTEKICKDENFRYPLLCLRILNHLIGGIDEDGIVYISPRRLSIKINAHYNTVTKCLKYLRGLGVFQIEKQI